MLERPKDSSVVITSGRTLDHAAKVYDVVSPLMTFGQERRFSREAIELLELREEEKVLDIGCGTGTLTAKISKRLSQRKKPQVIGLDAAPKMIEVARRKSKHLRNIRFDIGAAERLPYEKDFFDCAVSTFFFHHVNLELKKRSLEEIRRVLKNGGRAVIVDVDTPTNFFGRLCAYAGYWIFEQEEILENIKGKLKESLEQGGFKSCQLVSHHMGYISVFKLIK